jgi:hypothetical protein
MRIWIVVGASVLLSLCLWAPLSEAATRNDLIGAWRLVDIGGNPAWESA